MKIFTQPPLPFRKMTKAHTTTNDINLLQQRFDQKSPSEQLLLIASSGPEGNSEIRKGRIHRVLQEGAAINARDEQDRTALHLLLEKGDNSSAAFLLGKDDIEINTQSKDGFSPLMVTARNANRIGADLLLDHPKKVNAAVFTLSNETALSLSIIPATDPATLAASLHITKRLLQPALSPNLNQVILRDSVMMETNFGLAHRAAYHGRLDLLQELVKTGVNTATQTAEGKFVTDMYQAGTGKTNLEALNKILLPSAELNAARASQASPKAMSCVIL